MIDGILIALLAVSAIWTVMTLRLLRSGVGLALTSALLAIVLYRLSAPTAAVFELSVCAGLIPVIFITTIGFTRRMTGQDMGKLRREGLKRFWLLPFLVIAVTLPLLLSEPKLDIVIPQIQGNDVRVVLWMQRHLDLLGQMMLLLVGALGVAVFFKRKEGEQ